jgi:CRISPR-associated protein Cmr2
MATYLFRASFSPVQSFIAQARKLQDMYAGSFLLSHLAKTIIEAVRVNGAIILYPKYDENRGTYPNLFMAKVTVDTSEQLKEFAAKIENSLRGEWRRIAEDVMTNWNVTPNDEFRSQIDNLWQFYWSATEYKEGAEYREKFVETLRKMGAAKTTRSFVKLPQEAGRKCDIAPEYNALFCRSRKGHMNPETTFELRDIGDKYLKDGEVLSGVAFVKRCLKFSISDFDDNFPSVKEVALKERIREEKDREPKPEDDKYYALVQFDGDNMGSLYSSPLVKPERLEEFQKDLSAMVSESSENMSRFFLNDSVKDLTKGVVIYAGGDDFLGAMNLDTVFQTLSVLRKNFQETIDISGYIPGYKATFSAGIVIAHIKTPLGEVLRWARESESRAKAYKRSEDGKEKEKDAYCLTILKASGEISQYSHSFLLKHADDKGVIQELDGMTVLHELIDALSLKDVSTSFIYQLSDEFERVESDKWQKILKLEAKRILKRSETPDDAVKSIEENLEKLLQGGDSKDDFLNLLRSAAFIARQRGGAK